MQLIPSGCPPACTCRAQGFGGGRRGSQQRGDGQPGRLLGRHGWRSIGAAPCSPGCSGPNALLAPTSFDGMAAAAAAAGATQQRQQQAGAPAAHGWRGATGAAGQRVGAGSYKWSNGFVFSGTYDAWGRKSGACPGLGLPSVGPGAILAPRRPLRDGTQATGGWRWATAPTTRASGRTTRSRCAGQTRLTPARRTLRAARRCTPPRRRARAPTPPAWRRAVASASLPTAAATRASSTWARCTARARCSSAPATATPAASPAIASAAAAASSCPTGVWWRATFQTTGRTVRGGRSRQPGRSTWASSRTAHAAGAAAAASQTAACTR
jgi:hypothetical protein